MLQWNVELCVIFFSNKKQGKFCKEVTRVIKSDGKILVIDWADSFGGIGPDKKDIVTAEMCQKTFLNNGFEFEGKLMRACIIMDLCLKALRHILS